MSERNKSLLIILTTLLIGMLIGALAWSGVSRKRQNRLTNLRQTDAMVDFVIQNLEPLEAEQRASIIEIVHAHGDEITEMRNDMRDLQNSLKTDLSEILSEEQRTKLDKVMRNRRIRRSRGDGPPRGDRMRRGPRNGPEGDSLNASRPGERRDRRRGRRSERPDSTETQ